MDKANIMKALELAREMAADIGAEILLDDDAIIDDDHLDSFWYGGEIGRIRFANGWTVVVVVNGKVRITAVINGEEYEYTSEDNSGAYNDDIAKVITGDKMLYALENEIGNDDYLSYGNNNWVEYNLLSPGGEFIDLGMEGDNIVDNVLDAFTNVEDYIPIIRAYADDECATPKADASAADKMAELKKALFNAGRDAIEEFLGYDIPDDEDDDVTDNRLDMAINAMSDDDIAVAYAKLV